MLVTDSTSLILLKIKNGSRTGSDNHSLKRGKLITFANPYSYLQLRKDANIVKDFNYIYVDGFMLLKLYNILMNSSLKRMSFDMTSLAPIVFEKAESECKTIFFVGGEAGVADGAVNQFKVLYPALKVIGVRNGYFSTEIERTDFIRFLVNLMPDIVIVGMGTPYQEIFLSDLSSMGWQGSGYTCGGFLHQTVKRGVQYYPKWMDKLNLRWLYRMYDEPKLIKRYFIYYPFFVCVFVYDVIRYKLFSDVYNGR